MKSNTQTTKAAAKHETKLSISLRLASRGGGSAPCCQSRVRSVQPGTGLPPAGVLHYLVCTWPAGESEQEGWPELRHMAAPMQEVGLEASREPSLQQ